MADERSFAFDFGGGMRSLPRPVQAFVLVCAIGLFVGVGLAIRPAGSHVAETAGPSGALDAQDLAAVGPDGVAGPEVVVQTPAEPAGGGSAAPGGDPARPAVSAVSAPKPPAPMSIGIPAIGVSSHVVQLGLQPDGTLQTPSDYGEAGWWSGGPTPGAVGPAVIVGHVDSTAGPAVFFHLRDLKPGDLIWVTRADGTKVSFVVRRLEQVPKAHFPTKEVYGPQPYAALRLITCGGVFDHSTGHYLDNLIVFADAA